MAHAAGDGLFGDEEHLSDDAVGLAAGQEQGHFDLALGQPVRTIESDLITFFSAGERETAQRIRTATSSSGVRSSPTLPYR